MKYREREKSLKFQFNISKKWNNYQTRRRIWQNKNEKRNIKLYRNNYDARKLERNFFSQNKEENLLNRFRFSDIDFCVCCWMFKVFLGNLFPKNHKHHHSFSFDSNRFLVKLSENFLVFQNDDDDDDRSMTDYLHTSMSIITRNESFIGSQKKKFKVKKVW